jgi:hypothetical protein
MVREKRFGLVAKVHEELNVFGRAQHGTGVKLMGIGRRSFDLTDQRLADPSRLVRGTHGEQPYHADAGHGPKAHGADDLSFRLGHENMLLPRIFLETFEGFRCPTAQFVDARIFAERGLLHFEETGKVYFGGWSNMNHGLSPGLEDDAYSFLHSGMRNDSQER